MSITLFYIHGRYCTLHELPVEHIPVVKHIRLLPAGNFALVEIQVS